MINDLDYYKEGLRKIHCIQEKEEIELLYKLAEKIKEYNLNVIELIELLRNVDTEIVSDILNVLITENFLTEEDRDSVTDGLKQIYENEYLRDKENGTFKKRLALKPNKNKRPISRHEILAIYFKKTLNAKLLWGIEKTDDEFLLSLIDDFTVLREIRKSNEMFRKQREGMKKVLTELIEKVKNFKIDEMKNQLS